MKKIDKKTKKRVCHGLMTHPLLMDVNLSPCKDNIYRIILRLNDNYPMAKVKYRFVNAK